MLPKTAKDTKDSQSRLDFFLMQNGLQMGSTHHPVVVSSALGDGDVAVSPSGGLVLL